MSTLSTNDQRPLSIVDCLGLQQHLWRKVGGVLVNKLMMAQSDGKFPFLFYFFIDSIAVPLYMDDLEFYKFVADNKVQISILIMRRGALSRQSLQLDWLRLTPP